MLKKLKDKLGSISVEVKASMAYTICSILQKCLSFITLPLFTRLLTTEQYGQYSVYTSWSSILTIFLTLNLAYGSFNTAMVRFDKDRRGYISSIQGLTVVLCAAFCVLYMPLRGFWNRLFELPTELVLLMIVEILAQFSLQCWFGVKRFEFEYRSVIVVTLLVAILSPVMAYILVINSQERGIARIIGYGLVNIAVGLVAFILNLTKGKKPLKGEYWRYALRFNIPLIPYYLSQVIFNMSDRIMISHICGTDMAGMYSVAYSLSTVLNFVLNAINNSYVPWLYGRIHAGEERENRSISTGITILMAFLLLGVIALAPEFILIMAGKEYAQAVWVVPPVTMSILLLFYAQLFINVEFYYEEKSMLVWGSIGAAVLNLVLNALLIPVFGFVAAGYTTLVSYVVFAVTNYYTMRRMLKKRNLVCDAFDLRALIIVFIVFMILSFTAMALYEHLVIRYSIIAAVLVGLVIKRKDAISFVKKTVLRK